MQIQQPTGAMYASSVLLPNIECYQNVGSKTAGSMQQLHTLPLAWGWF
jgi:hypothetical protein